MKLARHTMILICFNLFMWGFVVGANLGKYQGRVDTQQKAIEANVAKWIVDDKGVSSFEWMKKENCQ